MCVPLALNNMMSGLTTGIISWKLESTNTVTATFKDFKVLEGENIMESSKLTFQSLLQNIHNIQWYVIILTNKLNIIISSNSLDTEHLDVGFWLEGRIVVAKVEDAPHVGSEPEVGPLVGLVAPYQYWMWDRKETDQSSILEEPDNLSLVSQTFVYTHLLHLWHQNLRCKYRLVRRFVLVSKFAF